MDGNDHEGLPATHVELGHAGDTRTHTKTALGGEEMKGLSEFAARYDFQCGWHRAKVDAL